MSANKKQDDPKASFRSDNLSTKSFAEQLQEEANRYSKYLWKDLLSYYLGQSEEEMRLNHDKLIESTRRTRARLLELDKRSKTFRLNKAFDDNSSTDKKQEGSKSNSEKDCSND